MIQQHSPEPVARMNGIFIPSDYFDSSILEFVDQAMENWRLQGSDPVDAKGLVQVLPFFNFMLIIRSSIVRPQRHFNRPV